MNFAILGFGNIFVFAFELNFCVVLGVTSSKVMMLQGIFLFSPLFLPYPKEHTFVWPL